VTSERPRLVFVSFPDVDVADRVGRVLVDEGRVACITIVPGARSIYRWQGAIETASEVLGLMKTTQGAIDAGLVARIAALHPYQVPEVLVVDVDAGLPAYLQWLVASTMPSQQKTSTT
jgi:periplasmic divalent cation tolerance protein